MLAFPSLNIQATAGVEDDEQGMAGGLFNSSAQVGGAILLAVVTAVLTANGGAGASAHALLGAFRPSLAVISGVSVLGLLLAVRGLLAARRTASAPTDVAAATDVIEPAAIAEPVLAQGAGEALATSTA